MNIVDAEGFLVTGRLQMRIRMEDRYEIPSEKQ